MDRAQGAFEYAFDFRPSSFKVFRRFFISLHDHFVPHSRNNYHPHILSHRMMGLMAVMLVVVKITSVSFAVLLPVHTAHSSGISVENVAALANQSRASHDLNSLNLNVVLSRAAQAKADDMMLKQYFSHNTPEGNTPWKFIREAGYSYVAAGENLAIDFHDAETMQSAWMNSPGHRANILNKNFQEIGVGIANGLFEGKKSTIVVQMFGTPIAQQIALAVEPTTLSNLPDTTHKVSHESVLLADKFKSAPQILQTNQTIFDDSMTIAVTTNATPVKVMASYGDKAMMLDPVSETVWIGHIPLTSLGSDSNLLVTAYDINGQIDSEQVIQITPALNDLNTGGVVEGVNVTFLGKIFNPKILEQNIFWGVALFVLITLLLGIVIQRRVQHVSMIANASFVVMLASILTMT